MVHLVRMPPGRLPLKVFQEEAPGRSRTHWRDYISHLAWERLRLPQEEPESVFGERDVWVSLLVVLPQQPCTRTWLHSSGRVDVSGRGLAEEVERTEGVMYF